ncbi:hypothetical protein M0804_015548 [Polistes exclamans]|nr:hypothetical protein M0804_015548 [Polistes exclamans]
MIVFTVASVFFIYIIFYVGQRLLDHSITAFEELCQVPFYMLSPKTQKLFLFLITRSRKPSFLSIGGLYVSSHEMFAAILQLSADWKDIRENIELIVFAVASVVMIYIIFYVGQSLLDHSTTAFEEL